MGIILIIVGVVFYGFIHHSLRGMGETPRSRGSLRYQRRKARKLGLPVDLVNIRPKMEDTAFSNGVLKYKNHYGLVMALWLASFVLWGWVAMAFLNLDLIWFLLWPIALSLCALVFNNLRNKHIKK